MKRKLFLILSLFLGLMAKAQNNISVASFRLLPNDMTANTQGTMRTDQNGHTAALIKVVTTQTGFTFDVGMMGIVDTKQEPGEIWVYVPFGVKHITIRHPQLGVLRDYYFPITIEVARTYEMVLASGTVSTIVESDVGGSYLMMTVEPKMAMVYIDEQLKAIENGEVMLLLPYGKHTYRVEAPSYMNEAGAVEIGKERVELNVKLSSAKATLTVNCPDAEADIYINEQKKGHGSWTGQIVDGMYVVEARKAGHRTEKQSLTLAKQEQKTITLNAPQPIYGKLNLTSTPGNCEVYLDGKMIGKSPDVFTNVLVGEHSVELRKEGYDTYKGMVEVKEGAIAELNATLSNTAETAKYAYEMGKKYYNGTDVPQDYAEAVKWYRKAAEQGYARGQTNLGAMYCYGHGVSQDYAEALKWFRKAAEQGDASGQYNLGYMYRNGHGISQNYTEAVKWFRKSAEQGDANGQCYLGAMYYYGHGVTKDYTEAVKWLRKSAEQGNAEGQVILGVMYELGHGVSKDYVEAVKWYRKAAEQGDAIGQYCLGFMYESGRGVAKDLREARKWYRKAADQGYEDAMRRLKNL